MTKCEEDGVAPAALYVVAPPCLFDHFPTFALISQQNYILSPAATTASCLEGGHTGYYHNAWSLHTLRLQNRALLIIDLQT